MGLGVGIGFPIFIVSRDKLDEDRVEALRELNKETYEATGEYLSKVPLCSSPPPTRNAFLHSHLQEELAKIRPPRWTDRREFKDDD